MFRKIVTYVWAAVFGAGLFAATQAMSQSEKPEGMPDMDEMMKMYEKANTPGPEHARFKDAVGTWKTETKTWMGPGEPQVNSGTSEMKLLFDGRYLTEDYRCDMMDRPFRGMALIGYDNQKKKHVSIWVDSMSTGIMMMEGERKDDKTVVAIGAYDDPIMGPSKMKNVMREISDSKHIMEMYRVMPDGTEQKEMEITYTR